MHELIWKMESAWPQTIEVGRGSVIAAKGYCFFVNGPLRELTLMLGSQRHSIASIGEPRDDVFQAYVGLDQEGYSRLSGFWDTIPLSADLCGQTLPVALEATDTHGDRARVELGEHSFVARADVEKPDFAAKSGPDSGVAICMATYEPDLEAFARQIDSILAQTHDNWICIVNDDGSTPDRYARIKELCGKDPRFFVYQNTNNQGFYRNFETCLKRVPDTISFVALADQDDYWYPEKLQRCLERFDSETQLVYSDMRIIDENGSVISDTYWKRRKNNYTKLDVLLIANTITGAASMFRAALIDQLIPFPERIGHSFHDHWIGLVALATGRIEYIDEPLYDYIQYEDSVIGHCDFAPVTVQRRMRGVARWVGKLAGAIARRMRRGLAFGRIKENVLFLRDRLVDIYEHEYRRLQLLGEVLQIRTGASDGKAERFRNLFSGRSSTMLALLGAHTRIWFQRETTNDAELRLLLAYITYRMNRFVVRIARPRYVRKSQALLEADARNNAQVVDFLRAKIAPLVLDIQETQPRRINIIVPEVKFDVLFGGYLGKLNLARRLIEEGHRVRMLVVDDCEIDPAALNRLGLLDPRLSSALCRLEIQACYDRTQTIGMHPRDVLVATTWWTAHIAHAALQHLTAERFLYLIQEYEPFTSPLGTYYSLAEQSYRLPHHALFSSQILRDFFAEQGIGVFADDSGTDARQAAFENAVTAPSVSVEKLASHKQKRLLFYARSGTHAARNLFEIGVLGLEKAIAEGTFPADEWEFWAMGSTYGELPLADGRTLKMVGKLALDEYHKQLAEFDLGMSLMYTPHPSLVPIEMAAAGLVVVTTNCMNKTEERLRDISQNILGVDATVEAVAAGLRAAAARVPDLEARVAGAHVNWSTRWEATFPKPLIDDVLGWFSAATIDMANTPEISAEAGPQDITGSAVGE